MLEDLCLSAKDSTCSSEITTPDPGRELCATWEFSWQPRLPPHGWSWDPLSHKACLRGAWGWCGWKWPWGGSCFPGIVQVSGLLFLRKRQGNCGGQVVRAPWGHSPTGAGGQGSIFTSPEAADEKTPFLKAAESQGFLGRGARSQPAFDPFSFRQRNFHSSLLGTEFISGNTFPGMRVRQVQGSWVGLAFERKAALYSLFPLATLIAVGCSLLWILQRNGNSSSES